MRILYIAKHGPHDNRDEQAIGWALEQLGHNVIRIEEQFASSILKSTNCQSGIDFALFHHWMDLETITNIVTLPKVFWTFDLMYSDDSWLSTRVNYRDSWLNTLLPQVLCGFCTDGDCVARNNASGKLFHLLQGMDEQVAGYGNPTENLPPIIFTGTIRHGQQRAKHIEELQSKYGPKFQVIGNGKPTFKKHGRALADVFASTKIVIAPDAPCSPRYWSNRIYLTTGLGGFLLHPYCNGITEQYPRNKPDGSYPCPGTKVDMYESRQELYGMIDYYLAHDEKREEIRRAGYEWTMAHHTYRHRCDDLIKTVKERI